MFLLNVFDQACFVARTCNLLSIKFHNKPGFSGVVYVLHKLRRWSSIKLFVCQRIELDGGIAQLHAT